ncbi:hypothetical protein ANCDUO_01083 [Ancylostoma duodenale]|uniref:Uncharacterized protein n=1 Tax=Ancylostoma duodenale TaxID=51022 RepID=A0A0C2HG56_9BILA|nr:hypothetical protein ANCDUO_01083 [Ancylostoma duodenale]
MRKVMSGQRSDTSSSRDLLPDLFETDPVTTESMPDRSEGLRVEGQSEVVDSREPSGNSILGNIEPSDLTTQENGNGLPRRRTVTFAPLPVRKSTRQRRPPLQTATSRRFLCCVVELLTCCCAASSRLGSIGQRDDYYSLAPSIDDFCISISTMSCLNNYVIGILLSLFRPCGVKDALMFFDLAVHPYASACPCEL